MCRYLTKNLLCLFYSVFGLDLLWPKLNGQQLFWRNICACILQQIVSHRAFRSGSSGAVHLLLQRWPSDFLGCFWSASSGSRGLVLTFSVHNTMAVPLHTVWARTRSHSCLSLLALNRAIAMPWPDSKAARHSGGIDDGVGYVVSSKLGTIAFVHLSCVFVEHALPLFEFYRLVAVSANPHSLVICQFWQHLFIARALIANGSPTFPTMMLSIDKRKLLLTYEAVVDFWIDPNRPLRFLNLIYPK